MLLALLATGPALSRVFDCDVSARNERPASRFAGGVWEENKIRGRKKKDGGKQKGGVVVGWEGGSCCLCRTCEAGIVRED